MINRRYYTTKIGRGATPFRIVDGATGGTLHDLKFSCEYDAALYIKENLMTESLFDKPHPASVSSDTAIVIDFKNKIEEMAQTLLELGFKHERLLKKEAFKASLTITFRTGDVTTLEYTDSTNVESLRNMLLEDIAGFILNYRQRLKELTEAFTKTL